MPFNFQDLDAKNAAEAAVSMIVALFPHVHADQARALVYAIVQSAVLEAREEIGYAIRPPVP